MKCSRPWSCFAKMTTLGPLQPEVAREGRMSGIFIGWPTKMPGKKLPDWRCTCKGGLVLPAHARNAIEHSADDVHPVVDVDEVHGRHNQQRYAQIGAMPGGTGKTGHGRAHQEVRECPFIARGPDLS